MDDINKEKVNEGIKHLGDGVRCFFDSGMDTETFSEISVLVCKAIRISCERREIDMFEDIK